MGTYLGATGEFCVVHVEYVDGKIETLEDVSQYSQGEFMIYFLDANGRIIKAVSAREVRSWAPERIL